MGVCEFLYFPTIPAKVTINEFIEIAKTYSTPQSAQFVNGVLDNILKDLVKENKIIKQERNGKS
jgi:N utilization substance protein B